LNKKINIFLITIDCLRYDHVGCFGNKEKLTPNIDDISNNSVLFSQAIVNGSSTPFSFPSIFSSSYPLIDPNFPNLSRFRLTLPEILKNKGFKTAGFNSNPYLSKYYNYDIGFTYFDDIFSKTKEQNQKGVKGFIKKHKKLNSIITKIYAKLRIKHKIKPPYERAEDINQRVLSWVKENPKGIFVWMHYMDTHHPFLPPKEFRNTSARKMYRAEKILGRNPPKMSEKELKNIKNLYKGTIRYVDYAIGNFFNELKNLGVYKNSLIIITSDHGEEFLDHRGVSHVWKLYEELIHVPLLFKFPGRLRQLKVNKLVTLLDLAPSIIDYLGFEKVDDFLGVSFMSVINEDKQQYYRKSVISESLTKDGNISLSYKEGYRVTSYRTEKWKLILNQETNLKELYNLKDDPYESKNIYNDNEKIAKDFEQKIADHIEKEEILRDKFRKRQKLRDVVKKISF